MGRQQLTVAQATLAQMVVALDKNQGTLQLSNKHQSLDVVSYRVWGEELRLKDFMPVFADLKVKQSQPFRWYETSQGRGKQVAADATFTRSLGMGQEVEVMIEILHSGSIMLRLTAKSGSYSFNRF